jgi:hypothetical protein
MRLAVCILVISLSGLGAALAQDGAPLKFSDDFDADIASDWIIQGDNYGMVNQQLNSLGHFMANVGNINWDNYAVEFDLVDLSNRSNLRILVRRQSDDDYMSLQLYRRGNTCEAAWIIMTNGTEQELVNSRSDISKENGCSGHYRIEITDNMYKALKDSARFLIFTNNNLPHGNVGLLGLDRDTNFIVDNFKILNMP